MSSTMIGGGRAAAMLCLVLWAGCLDEDGEDCVPAPWDCDRSFPSSATLEIRTGGGALQQIRVYAGSAFEDGKLVWSGQTGRSLALPLGPYSAVAEYRVNGVTVLAVDGADLSYSESETCSGTCYEAVDGVVELELEEE